MPNYGLCADCNKEVELMQNGCCSICQSESTMKRGAISELELNKQLRREELARIVTIQIRAITYSTENNLEHVEALIFAIKEMANV